MSLANQLDKEVLPYLNGDYFPACENLKALYFQDRAVRSCHLESFAARRFFGDRDLPTDVGHLIRNGFLQGFTSRMITGSERVSEYFSRESRIIPELSANPGTYSMLERVYSLEGVEGPFDRALVFSRSAQAVRNRLNATIGFLARNLKSMIRGSEERLLVINLGAGTARDTTEVSRISGLIERNVKFDNVDLDPGAVEEGRRIARKAGVANAEFLEANMFGLRTRYRKSGDLGILNGFLCGLPYEEAVRTLRVVKGYFRPGARVIAALLTDRMLIHDAWLCYVLREYAGWELLHRERGLVRSMFEEAGYKWGGMFHDEPTRFYDIGIGIVP